MSFYQNLNQKQRPAFIIISAILLFVIIIFIAAYIMRIGKTEVIIQYAPLDSKITLNGTMIKNKTTKWLEPGNYEVIVEREHFETAKRIVTIDSNHKYIVGVLDAADNEGEEYIEAHKQEFIDTEGLIGRALSEEGALIKEQYPILNYLPINNNLYSISYTYNKDRVPIINVKTEPEYLDAAISKMKQFENVDLTSYQINFTSNNPLSSYQESIKANPKDTIKSTFDLNKYKISNEQYINEEYFVATLYTYDYNRDLSYGHYRVLLQKQDNNWHIVATPQPLLTIYNTPETNKEILQSANSPEP